ncbi:MAG: hypothetical protein IH960_11010 [Chloroflexi bacterium]|nr:hypothetical protein [Chloroflexota bacterium]MCH8911852.1 hypothetical protein [Chloroflexota bacterium]
MFVDCAKWVGVGVGGRAVAAGDAVIALWASDTGLVKADTSDSNNAPEAQARK